MKITLTIEFIACLIFLIGWGYDVYLYDKHHSDDGGWTTKYTYSIKGRKFAYRMSYLASLIGIIGILYLIWS